VTSSVAPTTTAVVAPPRGRITARRGRRRRKLTFDYVSFMLVFLGVPVAVVLVFVVWPFIQAGYYAMTDWTGFQANFNFIGFDNFTSLWDDKTFRKSVRNNIIMAIVVPFVTIVISLTFATMITIGGSSRGNLRGIRNSTLYRVVSFFPYVVPAIVIGLIWSKIFDPANGLLNGVLTGLGLSQFDTFAWLGEESTARWAVMFVIIWGFVGFYMVLFIAAIKGVPAEIYDAARIDGAGRLRMTFSVTIPLIRDNVPTAYIYLGILALDAFVYTQALAPEGGPNNSTRVMTQELFKTAFVDGKAGRASAMGVVLAAVTLVFAAIVFIVNRLAGGKERVQMA
jgi:N-acetylglucosamine transport system permease protein